MTIDIQEFGKLEPVTKEDDERLIKEAEREAARRYNKKSYLKRREKAGKYYQEHKKEKKEYNKQYKEENKEELKLSHAEYMRTEKGKAAMNRFQSKRRDLGFLELNESFEGAVAHHINKDTIVYVPKQLHQGVYHNLKTGQGMVEINNAVVEWLIDIGELMPLSK